MDDGRFARLIRARRPLYERAVLTSIVAAATCIAGGLVFLLFGPEAWATYDLWAVALGFAFLIVGLELSHPLLTLRTVGLDATMGTTYDRSKRWPVFRTTSVTLNLLTVVAAVALGAGLLSRLQVLHLGPSLGTFTRATSLVAMVLALNLCFSAYQALRTAARPAPILGPVATAGFHALVLAGLTLATFALVVTRRPIDMAGVSFTQGDASFLVLGALTTLSLALFVSRPLLTVYRLFLDQPGAQTTYESRHRSIVLPVTLAFALLFVVLFLALVFQLGLQRLFQEIPQNGFLLATVGFIALALAGAVWVTLLVGRGEDTPQLYRTTPLGQWRRDRMFLYIAGGTAAILATAALLVALEIPLGPWTVPATKWIDLAVIAILTGAGPYGFYYARQLNRIRRLEQRFPDFLRDIAASRKAGLTLPAAVQIAARGEYGELTPEIRKMADQLALNVPFDEALTRFGDRVDTPLVQRAVVLINEAGRSGGQVTDVLHAAAVDARELKTLENERHSTMMLYTIIIYIIFGVFLFVCAVLYGTFIPEYLKASQAAVGEGATQLGALVLQGQTKEGYRAFYFIASLVQAVGNGFIAGLIGTGKALAGLRHSFVMVLVTYLTFAVFLP